MRVARAYAGRITNVDDANAAVAASRVGPNNKGKAAAGAAARAPPASRAGSATAGAASRADGA